MYKFEKTTHVDVVSDISYQEYHAKYLSKLKPVIIKGALSGMPALQKWSLDYLREKIGHKKIQLTHHHNSSYEWDMAAFFEYLSDAGSAAEKKYLTQANIVKYFPELLDDLGEYPQYGLPDWKSNVLLPKDMFYQNYQVELLMGKAGTGFFLHYDRGFMNAFVGQVYGQKEVVLIPPEDSQYLYPRKQDIARADVDIWDLDTVKYPQALKARPFFTVLEPGDLVYIPPSWWHSTRNKTLSIGFTFNSVYRPNWKMFSEYMVADHKKIRDPKYPAIVVSMVLKLVGWLESCREYVFGRKPRKGNQQKIWKRT